MRFLSLLAFHGPCQQLLWSLTRFCRRHISRFWVFQICDDIVGLCFVLTSDSAFSVLSSYFSRGWLKFNPLGVVVITEFSGSLPINSISVGMMLFSLFLPCIRCKLCIICCHRCCVKLSLPVVVGNGVGLTWNLRSDQFFISLVYPLDHLTTYSTRLCVKVDTYFFADRSFRFPYFAV